MELTIGENWDPGPADIAAKQARRIKPHLQEALYEVEQAVEGLTREFFEGSLIGWPLKVTCTVSLLIRLGGSGAGLAGQLSGRGPAGFNRVSCGFRLPG